MYYDTLNATAFTPLQTGFSQNTTSALSVDFGQTFLLGDPKRGISPMLDPFPVQANGQRFQSVLGNSLGVNTVIGENHTAPNSNTEHARVQRWRVSVQREISRNMAVEVAYNGSFGDRLDATIRQDYLPEEWYNGSNVRDLTQQNLLNANVTNPFFIGNFQSLKTSDPQLYNRMAGNSFFTSPTIQRHRLLREFPEYNYAQLQHVAPREESGLVDRDQPQSKIRQRLLREPGVHGFQLRGAHNRGGVRP